MRWCSTGVFSDGCDNAKLLSSLCRKLPNLTVQVDKFGVFPGPAAPPNPREGVDLGRFNVTKVARDREVFRVPSLRNVALTAPYFHDGRARTLKKAVGTMAWVQLGRRLRPQEIDLIVEFLHTLTAE